MTFTKRNNVLLALARFVNEDLLKIAELTLASVSSETRSLGHQAPVPFLPDVCKQKSPVLFHQQSTGND